MLNIKVLCVGKVKENSLKNLIDEYLKRLSKYCKIEIVEIDDEKVPLNYSEIEKNLILNTEGSKICDKISKIGKCHIFLLDIDSIQYSSEDLAKKINDICTYKSSTIIFVIGGTLGIGSIVKKLEHEKISFSKLTFPHQLIRLFLLEQLFRVFKINNNETYHH
ncbi:MAG: 23S rRNA (pseudouridine(1915)-N(3))-methyltransferase RlmH [Clostridia bacterium]